MDDKSFSNLVGKLYEIDSNRGITESKEYKRPEGDFYELVKTLNDIDKEPLSEGAKKDQVKGREKAKQTGGNPHPFQGRLVGGESAEPEEDKEEINDDIDESADYGYGFLNNYVEEDSVDEDFVGKLERELRGFQNKSELDENTEHPAISHLEMAVDLLEDQPELAKLLQRMIKYLSSK